MFMGVLYLSINLEIEIKTDEQIKTKNRLQDRTQIIFSPDDCQKALSKAKAAHADQNGFKDAIKICRHVAAWGDIDTQFDLGILYAEGKNVEKNIKEAERWFEAAASQGHVAAQYKMMLLYAMKSYSAGKADSADTGILDFITSYGWFCVFEKQVATPGSSGLRIWNDPELGYEKTLPQISQAFAEDIERWRFPATLVLKKACNDYVKVLYKHPAP